MKVFTLMFVIWTGWSLQASADSLALSRKFACQRTSNKADRLYIQAQILPNQMPEAISVRIEGGWFRPELNMSGVKDRTVGEGIDYVITGGENPFSIINIQESKTDPEGRLQKFKFYPMGDPVKDAYECSSGLYVPRSW